MSLQPNKLCLVIPCYNEESILQDTVQQLLALLHNLEQEDLISKDSSSGLRSPPIVAIKPPCWRD